MRLKSTPRTLNSLHCQFTRGIHPLATRWISAGYPLYTRWMSAWSGDRADFPGSSQGYLEGKGGEHVAKRMSGSLLSQAHFKDLEVELEFMLTEEPAAPDGLDKGDEKFPNVRKKED